MNNLDKLLFKNNKLKKSMMNLLKIMKKNQKEFKIYQNKILNYKKKLETKKNTLKISHN